MPKPDRVAQALVQATLELHGRRLWLEVPGDAPFLVRLPDEPFPLAAVITGQQGREYGVVFRRGERAFAEMARHILEDEERPDQLDEDTILLLSVEALAEIPPHMRGLLADAGFQCRRESLAPFPIVKLPFQEARSPNRSERKLLLAAVRAILAAHDAGELHPTTPDLRRRRILEIAVEGAGREACVAARFVPWPQIPVLEPPRGSGLEDLDPALPRLDERWLVASRAGPIGLLDDGRSSAFLVVIEEKSGLALTSDLRGAGDLDALAEVLLSLFHGDPPEGRNGLPRAIAFDRERERRAFAEDLERVGVSAELEPDHPAVREFFDGFASALERVAETSAMDEAVPPPRTLSEWREADRRLTESLLRDLQEDGLAPEALLERYFGSAEIGRSVCEELADQQPLIALTEWHMADHRGTPGAPTIVERRLADPRTSPVERHLLEARRDAVLSVYRVDVLTPGATIEVEDVLSGERATIQDRALSGCDIQHLLLPLRLSRVADWTFCTLAGPPLGPLAAEGAFQHLESLGADLSPGGLRRTAHLVGRLWEFALARSQEPPQLCNTDGERIEWHQASYRVTDRAALERALAKRRNVDHDESDGSWRWFRAGGPHGMGQSTTLARIEMFGDEILLEVNSEGRLKRARKWFDRLPGIAFERAERRPDAEDEIPLDDALPARDPSVTPELSRELAAWHARACRRWLDEPVPALGNLTPRAACRIPGRRQQVARMIRTMPAALHPGGELQPPREELLRELGLESTTGE